MFRIERAEDDILTFEKLLGHRTPEAASHTCALPRSGIRANSASSKARRLPATVLDTAAYAALLRQKPALLQKVCRLLYQEMLCTGYDIPVVCQPSAAGAEGGGREEL